MIGFFNFKTLISISSMIHQLVSINSDGSNKSCSRSYVYYLTYLSIYFDGFIPKYSVNEVVK